ncbi:hypothetical protein J4230_05945 [Candidatus Woesearchaeota archaeon]|nr:hypothetical protein [Candidatus Woesearchaeota archaeon]
MKKVYKRSSHSVKNTSERRQSLDFLMFYFVSISLLIFSVVLSNLWLLYIGLLFSLFTIVGFFVIKFSSKNRHINKKVISVKQPVSGDVKLHSMRRFIALKHNKYETDLDKLYRLIEKYHVVKFSEVSKLFNIDNSKIEQWGKILESHSLAYTHYPTFGEPELRWKQ